MTEAEWLAEDNPARLLRVVRSSQWRKRCLFTCACWAIARDLLASEGSRAALASLEDVAEAQPPHDTFESVADTIYSVGVQEGESLWYGRFEADDGGFRAVT